MYIIRYNIIINNKWETFPATIKKLTNKEVNS